MLFQLNLKHRNHISRYTALPDFWRLAGQVNQFESVLIVWHRIADELPHLRKAFNGG